MENASKALIIAGSVLIAMIVLSILVWGWNRVSRYYESEENAETVQQLYQKNKELESYNKQIIRGYELRSLYNLMEDMNERYSTEKGYSPITAQLKLIKAIDGGSIEIKNSDNRFYSYNTDNTLTIFFKDYYLKHEDDKQYLKIFNESYFKCTDIKYNGELEGQDGKGTARVQSFKFEQIQPR